MESSGAAQYCQNCGQPLDPTARFCPSCGTARDARQPQPAPTQTPGGPMHPPQQQSGPSAGKVIAWVIGILATLLIGIPLALVLFVVFLQLL